MILKSRCSQSARGKTSTRAWHQEDARVPGTDRHGIPPRLESGSVPGITAMSSPPPL